MSRWCVLFLLTSLVTILEISLGALTTKGTRFVLANTEAYHVKISDMSERIRQLEQALGSLHPDMPHPLLRQDLLLVKVPVELNNKVDPVSFPEPSKSIKESPRFDDNLHLQDASLPVLLNASGTLKIRPNGRSTFFGQSANAEASHHHQLRCELNLCLCFFCSSSPR